MVEAKELSILLIEILVHVHFCFVVNFFRVRTLFFVLYFQISNLLVDVLQHLRCFVFKLVDWYSESVYALQDLNILNLLNDFLESLFELGMALPQFCIQIIQYFKAIDLTQLNPHLKQLLIMGQVNYLLLNFFQFLKPFHFLVDWVRTQLNHISPSVDGEWYWVIQFAYYLGNFKMYPSLNFLLIWTKHENLLVDAKVVSVPMGKYA